VGVGAYAAKRLSKLTGAPIEKGDETSPPENNTAIRVGQVLHPSPASPLANRGWAEQAHKTFVSFGLV
jgi:single-strand selective monofunctional uracil DNA glycosylase